MSHDGRSRHARSIDVKMKDEAARKAQQFADKLACEAWSARLRQLGGPLRPSPSIRAAISGGFRYLRVECSACNQHAWVDLAKVRRLPETSIWQLEGSLACRLCRRGRSFPPRTKIEMLCAYDKQMGSPPHLDRD
jgi:hypothetical protein